MARFYGPCVQLRRTIRSTLGTNIIRFTDEFHNAGNEEVPHAWLLHINFGYPLVDEGTEICYAGKVVPREDPMSMAYFKPAVQYRRVPAPLADHHGENSVVAYIFPTSGRDGRATVGLINRKLGLGVAIRYDTRQFSPLRQLAALGARRIRDRAGADERHGGRAR